MLPEVPVVEMSIENSDDSDSGPMCTQGPCWNGYVYVGPKPYARGSCIKKSNLCEKQSGRGVECKKYINCK